MTVFEKSAKLIKTIIFRASPFCNQRLQNNEYRIKKGEIHNKSKRKNDRAIGRFCLSLYSMRPIK